MNFRLIMGKVNLSQSLFSRLRLQRSLKEKLVEGEALAEGGVDKGSASGPVKQAIIEE